MESAAVTRAEVINQLMGDVRNALRGVSLMASSTQYPAMSMTLPSLGTTEVEYGMPTIDLITPPVSLPAEDQAQALWDSMPLLSAKRPSRVEVREASKLLTQPVALFALLSSTPEGRLGRILWAFARSQPSVIDMPDGIMIKSPTGDFGVWDGRLVGGPFEGFDIELPWIELASPTRKILIRNQKECTLYRALRRTYNEKGVHAYNTLYAIAEWDKSIPMSHLSVPVTRALQRRVQKLADIVWTSEDPIRDIYTVLVPFLMSYTEFEHTFGKATRRRSYTLEQRNVLANKISLLPFNP